MEYKVGDRVIFVDCDDSVPRAYNTANYCDARNALKLGEEYTILWISNLGSFGFKRGGYVYNRNQFEPVNDYYLLNDIII